MQFKSIVAAAALAAASVGAFAGDQTVSFDIDNTASFIGTKPLLVGGDDVITFDNLAAGTYDFLLTLSSQYITLQSVTLNGVSGTILQSGKIAFADIEGTGSTPFVLNVAGLVNDSKANYSGELSVTVVPEPETYALMLAGIGAIGFVARRRRAA